MEPLRALRVPALIVSVLSFISLFAFAEPAKGRPEGSKSRRHHRPGDGRAGAVLPGVTVTATSPALEWPQVVTVTDERGDYRLTPDWTVYGHI